MIGNRVEVTLTNPKDSITGELRKQNQEGIWLYYGWADHAAVHFFPTHRIVEILDLGPVYR